MDAVEGAANCVELEFCWEELWGRSPAECLMVANRKGSEHSRVRVVDEAMGVCQYNKRSEFDKEAGRREADTRGNLVLVRHSSVVTRNTRCSI